MEAAQTRCAQSLGPRPAHVRGRDRGWTGSAGWDRAHGHRHGARVVAGWASAGADGATSPPTCRDASSHPAPPIQELTSTYLATLLRISEAEPDQFWQAVKVNLQAGRVRLVFVADRIPPELRRVIEFLNAQMDPAEVLGVEIK